MKNILFLILVPITMFADKPKEEGGEYVKDEHSYSNPAEIVVQHLDLNLKADFSAKKLVGFVTLQIKNITNEIFHFFISIIQLILQQQR